MPRDVKAYHKNFLEYVNFIVEHEAYRGLPINKNRDGSYRFVATRQSKIGKERQRWVEQKADELGIEKTIGFASKVMRHIHPTKETVCQICGRSMSIFYVYLGKNAIGFFENEFGLTYEITTSINEVWSDLLHYGFTDKEIQDALFEKCDIKISENLGQEKCVSIIEEKCRSGQKKFLSPGAMSNFPDRFDGFHSYNRCCREKEDRGRHKENMDRYTKDRRAYERWSDGNLRAANQFMHSKFFKNTSADHIGPVSLGFVHDPRYFRPMPLGDNTTRQNQITKEDIDVLIEIEERTGIPAVSWHTLALWKYIKENYKTHTASIETVYKNALQQNMANLMQLLYLIITLCSEQGKHTLEECFIKPNYQSFDYDYQFDEKGNIIKRTKRNKTGRAANEYERYKRIAFAVVFDYTKKENRRIKPNIKRERLSQIEEICNNINANESQVAIKEMIVSTMTDIQNDTISQIESQIENANQ